MKIDINGEINSDRSKISMKFSKELIDQFFEMKIEMQGEAERLFEAFSSSNVETDLWRPPMDIYETVDSFFV